MVLKVKSCKFVGVITNVFLIGKQQQIGGWVFLKWTQIIAESIKIYKSRAGWKFSMVDTKSDLCEMSLNR